MLSDCYIAQLDYIKGYVAVAGWILAVKQTDLLFTGS